MISSIAQPAALAGHPAKEWWEVGNQRFDTTDDMVKNVHPDKDGAVCTFHYFEQPGEAEKTNVWASTLKGIAAGAVIGGLGGMAFGAVASAGIFILSAGFMTADAGAPVIMGVLGAVGGALLGGGAGHDSAKQFKQDGNEIFGTLYGEPRPDGAHLVFYPTGRTGPGVDLNGYEGAQSGDPWWKQQPATTE